MPNRVLTNEDSIISPATGKKIGQHEAAGLKGLTKEQHPRFWKEVTYWNTERFSEAKWQEVLKRIWRAKQENGMLVLGWHPPPRPIQSTPTSGGRHLLLHSFSSLTAPTGAHPLRPAHLPRIETASPTTPRPRWDVVSVGPATPLSATAGPVKNAFAEGGHWASLTSKTSSLAGTPTAVTATPPSPSFWTPDTPTSPMAKIAYQEAKADVNKMALQLCASRHALRRSFSAENDVIHPSMVRPRDTLLAAELTLASYKLPGSLSTYIDPHLPSKLEAFADEEVTGARQYSIGSKQMLRDVDAWLQADEVGGVMVLTTILEAQRDLLRMSRERRKGREVVVAEGGVGLAWVTKVASDVEMEARRWMDVEGEEMDSDDEGYEYGNFVRSLGGRGSTEMEAWRSSGETLDLALTMTNSSTDWSGGAESSVGMAQRSSSSPIKHTYNFGAGHDILPLGSRNFTLSSNLSTADPSSTSHSHAASDPDSYEPTCSSKYPPNYALGLSTHSIRRSNAIATSTRPRHKLSIDTTGINTSRESPLSPQERGTRRQGPSIQDLSSWADELRRMERKRAEVRLCSSGAAADRGGVGYRRCVSLRQDPDVDGKDDVEVVDVKENGLVINGCVHPALQGGGEGEGGEEGESGRSRGATGSSTASWRCGTAAAIERNGLADSSNMIDTIDHAYEDQACEDDVYGYKDDEDITTPTLEFMDGPTHPLRSSSSPTHPPIRLSSLPALRLSPPRRPPRPRSPPLLSRPGIPPDPILLPAAEYNRYASTSYERQASKPRPQPLSLTARQMGGEQIGGLNREQAGRARVVSKASLLEDVVRARGGGGLGRLGCMGEEKEKEKEWNEELKAMEERERMRQLGRDSDS